MVSHPEKDKFKINIRSFYHEKLYVEVALVFAISMELKINCLPTEAFTCAVCLTQNAILCALSYAHSPFRAQIYLISFLNDTRWFIPMHITSFQLVHTPLSACQVVYAQ